jgi:menaquinone-dependent protoporphyrinogen IX oxidase
MRTMVYYYTLSGHCEKLSGKIADQMHCESERIIEKQKRLSKGFLRFLNGRSALQKKSADVASVRNDPGQFERIVIVTPFWAASPTPAVRGFLEKYHQDLKGKKLGLILTNLGTDPAEVFPKYQELFPEPLVKRSFTKAKGEWQNPKEDEMIKQFVLEFDK